MNIEDSCISCIDTDWSYQLARRMEKKTNPVLGYRTAGSAAETATGDMLYREMKAIGLTDVTRDTFSLDGWEFEKAVLKFTDDDGQEHTFQMGGYQTNFETDGFEDYELVYLGKGTAADYEGINVKGKLVMVEINQRDEWWISFLFIRLICAALLPDRSSGKRLRRNRRVCAECTGYRRS